MNGIKHIARLGFLAGLLASAMSLPAPEFITSDEPPSDFELPQGPQETYADVYFLGQYLQASLININPDDTVTILDPKKLVDQMQGIINHEAIIKALSGPLPTHSNDQATVNPKVAAIIFDPQKLRLTIFINSDYLERAQQNKVSLLEKPNNAVSFVNEFHSTVAGPQDNTDFSLDNHTILAYQDFNITMLSNYFRHLSNTGEPDKKDNSYQVQQLYGTLQRWGKIMQTGMLKSKGDLFLGTNDILGAGVSSNLNQIKNLKSIRGLPIPIFISSPSLVEVYKDGQLIYSGRYNPGNHFLNTSSFPAGAYNINIKITDVGNNVREIQRFFEKNPSFPPMGHPQYFVNAGYLGKLEDNDDNYPLFQEYTTIAFGQIGGSIRLSPSWAGDENLITSSLLTASESNLTWLHNQQQIKFALLLTNKNDYGTGARYDVTWKKIIGGAGVTRIWGSYFAHQNKLDDNINVQPAAYNLVSLNKYMFSSSLAFPIGKASVSANMDIVQQFNQPFDRNYSVNVEYPLLNTSHVNINSQLSLNYSDGDKLGFLDISIAFKHNNWTNTLSGRTLHQKFQHTNDQNQQQKTTGYVKFASLWDKNVSGIYHAKLGGGATDDTEYRHFFASSYLNNRDLLFSLDVDRNLPRLSGEKDNVQYNGKFNTSLIIAEHDFGFENTEKGDTGFLIDIESPNSHDKFKVLVNNIPIQVIHANEPAFIFAEPYHEYEVSIHSLSDHYYSYDENNRAVTLYQNSIKYLQWKIQPQYSFITQLVDQQGMPIKNTELTANGKTVLTNDDGDLHIQLLQNTHQLNIKLPNGKVCSIKLPQTIEQDYIYVKRTMCQ